MPMLVVDDLLKVIKWHVGVTQNVKADGDEWRVTYKANGRSAYQAHFCRRKGVEVVAPLRESESLKAKG